MAIIFCDGEVKWHGNTFCQWRTTVWKLQKKCSHLFLLLAKVTWNRRTYYFCNMFSRNIFQVRVIFSLFHTVRTSRVVTQGSHHGEDEERRADYCSSNAKQLNHWQMAVLPDNFRIFLLITFSVKMIFKNWKYPELFKGINIFFFSI